jgi:hypothetical protein
MESNKEFIFICGLHRSGTSVFFKLLKNQNYASGFENTGAVEDEGQLLQTVYPRAMLYGGPGKFGFHPDSRMNENHTLATTESRDKLIEEWSPYWDMEKEVLLEKSPPNLLKSKFLQEVFPNSKYLTIIRHPIAVSLATQKWSKTSLDSLIEHWLKCHDIFNEDKSDLKDVLEFKYEGFVNNPTEVFDKISDFLGREVDVKESMIRKGVNEKYYKKWEELGESFLQKRKIKKIIEKYESRVNEYGYSLKAPYVL